MYLYMYAYACLIKAYTCTSVVPPTDLGPLGLVELVLRQLVRRDQLLVWWWEKSVCEHDELLVWWWGDSG